MCDRCTAQGVAALEAIANGEDPPEFPQLNVPTLPELQGYLPFPVMAFVTDNGNVGILTNSEGWKTIQGFLQGMTRDH